MRVFIAVLVLIFGFQSLTKADDIKDFEIEGMSVGDSLLEYTSEDVIKERKRSDYPKSKKFSRIVLSLPSFATFEDVQFHFKSNDKKYKIAAMEGINYYKNDIENCFNKKNEIVAEISNILEDAKTIDDGTNKNIDLNGNLRSRTTDFWFFLDSEDSISVRCYDWTEKYETEQGFEDSLKVAIQTKEFNYWISNEAF